MSNTKGETKRDFLYTDENVKYTVSKDGDQLTIRCEHPLFISRFGASTVTKPLQEFTTTTSKGMEDHNFFEKFIISLQEYFLTVGE